MPKQVIGNRATELWSDQQSGEVQYERERFPVRIPGSSGQGVDVFLGYRRSLDFDTRDNPGQDFAAVRGDDNGYVVGVVADGVSESFYGHLAACHLTESLLDTLWQKRERPPSEDELERELKELEEKVATEVVDNYPVPEDLLPVLRESLEDKRSKGSQTVFAAFVLDASEERLHLYQVGDVDAILHYPDKFPELIQAPSQGRWSSAGKSKMRLQLSTYEGVSGIVIKSDGAGRGWGKSLKDKALTRSAFDLLAEKQAGIDDLSFVAARWGEVLEAPETEIESSRPTEPAPPPRQRETEVLPGTSRYYPGPAIQVPSYTGPIGPGRGQFETGEGRGRNIPVEPSIGRNRVGDVPLLDASAMVATGAVAGILVAFVLVIAVFHGWLGEVQLLPPSVVVAAGAVAGILMALLAIAVFRGRLRDILLFAAGAVTGILMALLAIAVFGLWPSDVQLLATGAVVAAGAVAGILMALLAIAVFRGRLRDAPLLAAGATAGILMALLAIAVFHGWPGDVQLLLATGAVIAAGAVAGILMALLITAVFYGRLGDVSLLATSALAGVLMAVLITAVYSITFEAPSGPRDYESDQQYKPLQSAQFDGGSWLKEIHIRNGGGDGTEF